MIKTILVHLTGSEEDAVRLAHAERLAQSFDAHLSGVFVAVRPFLAMSSEFYASGASAELIEQVAREADAAFARAQQATRGLSVRFDLRRIDGELARAAQALAAEARTADLFIGTRPYGDPAREGLIEETVLFESGRGSLLLPPGVAEPFDLENVLVAWKSSRGAAHALAEAMPLLRRAKQVVVAVVEEHASEETGAAPGRAVAVQLDRLGIAAELRVLSGWSDAAAALQTTASQLGAGLIVSGAYGHSRLRELVMGGVTRQLLAQAKVPVLMAR